MTLAATAQRLIEANGEAVVFMAPATTPAFNPVTGAPQTPVAPDPVTGSGVPTRYKAHEVDGSTILAEDVRLLVGVGGPIPERGWSAQLAGDSFRVMDVQRIRKSGANVLLIAQLRRN